MITFKESRIDTNGGITVEYTENGESKTYQGVKMSKDTEEFVEFVNDELNKDKEFDTVEDMAATIAYLASVFVGDLVEDDYDEVIKCFSFKSAEKTEDGMILHYLDDDKEETINLFEFVAFNTIKDEDIEGLVEHLNSSETMKKVMFDSLLFLLIATATVAKRYLNNITDGDEMEEVQNEIVNAFQEVSAKG